MKILVAPDSFKGSLTALEVSKAIKQGIKEYNNNADIYIIPMADGGEGTVTSLVDATKGKIYKEKVIGPVGDIIEAYYGIIDNGKTAIIEMAAASGLPLVPEDKRNPMNTTTYGTGELIKAVLNKGCQKCIVGIGGSATNDGGIGMAQALGVSFKDSYGQEIGFGGKWLGEIKTIDMSNIDERIENLSIEVACDVNNPLCGRNGAANIYGPQKGATPEMIDKLDRGLKLYAELINKQLNKDIKDIPGSGAAGGLGAGMITFLDAKLKPGVDIIIDLLDLEEKVKDVDLVITGEGQLDDQTINGKTPIGVAKIANKHNIPVVAIGGSLKNSQILHEYSIDAIFSIIDRPMTMNEAINDVRILLKQTANEIIRLFDIHKSNKI